MKLERILSETNFPDSSNSSLEQPVLVHCLLCLSFSQSTQYSSVDWPILTPLDLPPPSPPCRGASRRFSKPKCPATFSPSAASAGAGSQARAAVSQRASQSLPVGLQSSSRLVEFQTVLHAVWICSWRSLLRPPQSPPPQSRKAPSPAQIRNPTEFNDLGLDAGPKIRDVQAIVATKRRVVSGATYYTTILDSQKPPFGFKLLLLLLVVVRLSAHRLHI